MLPCNRCRSGRPGVWKPVSNAAHCAGRPGVRTCNRTYLMEDDAARITRPTRCQPGWTTPRRSEHSWLQDLGHGLPYVKCTDEELPLTAFSCTDPASRASCRHWSLFSRVGLRDVSLGCYHDAPDQTRRGNLSGRGQDNPNTVRPELTASSLNRRCDISRIQACF